MCNLIQKDIIKKYFYIWHNEFMLDKCDTHGMSTRVFNQLMKEDEKKNRNNAYLTSYDYEEEH